MKIKIFIFIILVSFLTILSFVSAIQPPNEINQESSLTPINSNEGCYYLSNNPIRDMEDLGNIFNLDFSSEEKENYFERLKSEVYPLFNDTAICDIFTFLGLVNDKLDLGLEENTIQEKSEFIKQELEKEKCGGNSIDRLEEPNIEELLGSKKTMNNGSSLTPFSSIQKASPSLIMDTSDYLIGDTYIVLIFVDDSDNSWGTSDKNYAIGMIQETKDWMENNAPFQANVDVNYGYYSADISSDPNDCSDSDYDCKCQDWMNDALNDLGFYDSNNNDNAIDELNNYLLDYYNVENVYPIFMIRNAGLFKDDSSYSCSGEWIPRIALFYYEFCLLLCNKHESDVYIHESLHAFSADDEYKGPWTCDSSADCTREVRWGYTNGNCGYCSGTQNSIMKCCGSSSSIWASSYTKGQIGWGDHDGDYDLDPLDNCMYVYNPSQENADGDSEGNACDSDDDNDGTSDGSDSCKWNYGTWCNGCSEPICNENTESFCPISGQPFCEESELGLNGSLSFEIIDSLAGIGREGDIMEVCNGMNFLFNISYDVNLQCDLYGKEIVIETSRINSLFFKTINGQGSMTNELTWFPGDSIVWFECKKDSQLLKTQKIQINVHTEDSDFDGICDFYDVACSSNEECKNSSIIKYCDEDNACFNQTTYTCENPGTVDSSCVSSFSQECNSCEYTCSMGGCIRCNKDFDCNDDNPKSIDICINPGINISSCENIIDSEDPIIHRQYPLNNSYIDESLVNFNITYTEENLKNIYLNIYTEDYNCNSIPKEDASLLLVDYLNNLTGGGVEYVSSSEKNYFYEVTVEYQDQELPVFITRDGDYYIQGVTNISNNSGEPLFWRNAGNILINYLENITKENIDLVNIKSRGCLFKALVDYHGDEISIFITPDANYFIQGITNLNGESNIGYPEPEIPKSDKPEVELFVMTHCPYGTQAEKGIIPVFDLLGDKINSNIRFVHYFMHDPEEVETPIQICIREEQKDKYLSYLSCFLEDGDSNRCLSEVGIDESALDTCIDANAESYYAIDSGLSEGYGVRGSPTLVINGQIVQPRRSPDAYLQAICSAFNNVPEECNENLTDVTPGPGFGSSNNSNIAVASEGSEKEFLDRMSLPIPLQSNMELKTKSEEDLSTEVFGDFLEGHIMNCESGLNQECSIQLDFSKYNVSIIKYWFEIEDKISRKSKGPLSVLNFGEEPIICTQNSDCGTDEYIGNKYCREDAVYQDYQKFICENPGTAQSLCINQTIQKDLYVCASSSSGPEGDSYCKNENVYRNHTSSESGCLLGECYSNETFEEILVENCDEGCENEECIRQNFCTIISPEDEEIYNSRRIPIQITATEKLAKIEYLDQSDTRPRWRRICSRCDEYNRENSFTGKEHEIEIKCTPYSGEPEIHEINFLNDYTVPRISRTYPRRNSYTNGSGFYIKFKEDNPVNISINYNPTIYLNLSDCIESRGYKECYYDLNLEEKNGKEIEYQFAIEDIAGNTKESRKTKVKVDTTSPVINNPNDMLEKIYRGQVYLNISVNESNLNRVEYFDLNEDTRRQRWNRACTRLRDGLCKRRVRFKGDIPNMLIRVVDKAGNSVVEEV